MEKVVIKKCDCCDSKLSIFSIKLISRLNAESFAIEIEKYLKEHRFNGGVSLYGNNEVITNIQYEYKNKEEIQRAQELLALIKEKTSQYYCHQVHVSEIKFLDL
jgi:hypothetical protein